MPEKDQPVQQANLAPDGTTHNYIGPYHPSDPQDKGEDRHGHIQVDDRGNVKYERDVGEKGKK